MKTRERHAFRALTSVRFGAVEAVVRVGASVSHF